MTRACLGLAAFLAVSHPSLGDDFVDRANARYLSIPTAKRSDLIVLPALAKIEAPPFTVTNLIEDRLLVVAPGMKAWPAIETWLAAPAQQACLDAMRQAAAGETFADSMVFGQPYGTDGVPIEYVRKGLYTDLGDPPTIVAAKTGLVDALGVLSLMAWFECGRLADQGRPADAINLATDWLLFSRQIADRELQSEATLGYASLTLALIRIRDIAYEDFRSGDHHLDVAAIQSALERLKPERLALERITFPTADAFGAEQLLAQCFDSTGQPGADFATRMATLAARDHPLRLFGEVAFWDTIASSHKDLIDTRQAIERASGDWAARWPLDAFDERMREPFYFERIRTEPGLRFVQVALEDAASLYSVRQAVRTEAVGTRMSLGVLAYYYEFRNFPPLLASLRPRFLAEIEADPMNPARENKRIPPMGYFVPFGAGYREARLRETPAPHPMEIISKIYNFRAFVDLDEFVVYSTGSDGTQGWVDRVENSLAYSPNTDYLIWPPTITLLRRHMAQIGALD